MHAPVGEFTLCFSYYRQPKMLAEQIKAWEAYPESVKLILVDDGSPEPAENVLRECASYSLRSRMDLYRIETDIHWNRGEARNIGAHHARTSWILMADLDHVLPVECVDPLLAFEANNKCWYRCRRFRRGTADETRRKDAIPDDLEYGEIKEHCDSYLCTRRAYWENGGYDEDYSGVLGGGNPFLARMMEISRLEKAPENIWLEVYTRSVAEDSSEYSLSRDSSGYAKIRREKKRNNGGKDPKPVNPMRRPYHRVELAYPHVHDEFETLEKLEQGYSIARFGDGEFKLISGRTQIREPAKSVRSDGARLDIALKAVLDSPCTNCISAIPRMIEESPKYSNWKRHEQRFARLMNPREDYYSAFISRPDSAPWINTREFVDRMIALWEGKEALLVSEKETSIYRLVSMTAGKLIHIPCPHRETWSVSRAILKSIRLAKPDIVLLSCGPAATVMANDVCAMGIQAIDIGSGGQFMLSMIERKSA